MRLENPNSKKKVQKILGFVFRDYEYDDDILVVV